MCKKTKKNLKPFKTAIKKIKYSYCKNGIYSISVCTPCSLLGDEILTGSWRPENQLELWDFGTGKRLQGVHTEMK